MATTRREPAPPDAVPMPLKQRVPTGDSEPDTASVHDFGTLPQPGRKVADLPEPQFTAPSGNSPLPPEPPPPVAPNEVSALALDPRGVTHAPLPEPVPVSAGDRMVAVRPVKNFSSYIGDREWHFEKDKKYQVPASVAEVLMRAGKIWPSFV